MLKLEEKAVLEKFKEKDTETSLLFEDAIEKLDKIDVQANDSKKQIIINLAKNLEGKIPTDIISMEITDQLRGRVSPSLIRECLDEKYKVKFRVENAKKQKPRSQRELSLAPVVALNQQKELEEVTEQETIEKVDTIVDAGDKISIEEEKRGEPYTTIDFSFMTDKTIVPVSYQQQQEHKLKEKPNKELEECSSCKDLYDENLELKEVLQKSSQFATADMMLSTSATATYDVDKGNDVLPFEFSMLFRNIRNYMTPLHSRIGDNGEVWFNGKIDIKTGEVIYSNLGRMEQQYQDEFSI
jgi:hypothetical protein